jgi:hypothetical protein
MRVLFDQGTPVDIRNFLEGHDVHTAREKGWSNLSNGALLKAAEDAHFEVLLTTDNNLVHQQNLSHRKLAIVVLSRKPLEFRRPQNPRDRQRHRRGKAWQLSRRQYLIFRDFLERRRVPHLSFCKAANFS